MTNLPHMARILLVDDNAMDVPVDATNLLLIGLRRLHLYCGFRPPLQGSAAGNAS